MFTLKKSTHENCFWTRKASSEYTFHQPHLSQFPSSNNNNNNRPPMPGQNFPPMPGQGQGGHPGQFNPMVGQIQPPMGGQRPMVGQPPMGMQPPMGGLPPMGSQPPMSGQSPMGGQPPMGMNPAMGGPPRGPPQGQGRQGLDPDKIPHPIDVMKKDFEAHGKQPYATGDPTNIGPTPPPLTTTLRQSRHIPEDKGISVPDFIRAATYAIPANSDLAKATKLPITFTCQPFYRNNEAPPLYTVEHQNGPIRCKRCRAYVCPAFKFIDGGRKMYCPFCCVSSEVPDYYQNHLDHNGNRVDRNQRAELCRGSFEYIATKEYCAEGKLPDPPGLVFCIDVTVNAVKSGMVRVACEKIKDMLDKLPRDRNQPVSSMRIGIICYTKVLHFFNINKDLATPKHMVVSDIEDIFVPLQEGFLADPMESRELLDVLLDQIPNMFNINNTSAASDSVYAPVIQAGCEALKANNCPGKILMFHSSGLPTADAPGKLKPHEDKKLLGSNKEHLLWTAADKVYTTVAKQCVDAGVGVDTFLFTSQHVDLATLSECSNMTAGTVYKYSYFDEKKDREQFTKDIEYFWVFRLFFRN